MDIDDYTDTPPPLDVRWLHLGTPWLDLNGVPVANPPPHYAAFNPSDSLALETVFLSDALTDEDREATRTKNPTLEATQKQEKLEKRRKAEKAAAAEKSHKGGKGEEEAEELGDAGAGRARKGGKKKGNGTAGGRGGEEEMGERFGESIEEMERREGVLGVPIGQDGLFEVDVKEMKLVPVYWIHRGPNIPVRRGRWFFDPHHPCSEELSDELEDGFMKIRPWIPSYPEELKTALEFGKEAEEKLRCPLESPQHDYAGMFVVFQNEGCARIISESMSSRLNATIWSALRYGRDSGGTLVYRGFSSASSPLKGPSPSSGTSTPTSTSFSTNNRARAPSLSSSSANPSRSSSANPGPRSSFSGIDRSRRSLDEVRRSMNEEVKRNMDGVTEGLRQGAMGLHEGVKEGGRKIGDGVRGLNVNGNGVESSEGKTGFGWKRDEKAEGVEVPDGAGSTGPPPSQEVTDLIFVVHGIGQQLATTNEAFSFVYATNDLRKEAQRQADGPAIRSIMRDRKVQFLPIQWRASLKPQTKEEQEEDLEHELDNVFNLNDITLKKTIPYVRELTNNVLIDIPYFMTPHHRERMVEAVSRECNRTYRLWCRRHPSFPSTGKVHVIAHSLGSALLGEILSHQETTVPPLGELSKEQLYGTRDQFIFNTHALFLVGSPLGLFLHLHQAQLIPRKGRERTMNSPPDEALDRAGRFGCLAVDSLYNCYNPSDPIAYSLNATVDRALAASPAKEPLAISSVTAGILTNLSESVGRGVGTLGRVFGGLAYFGASSGGGTNASTSTGGSKRPETIRLPSGLELSGKPGQERLKGSKAERRFSALNPHGTVDFYLQTEGSISQYLDMVYAHSSYWADPSFAAFILAEIFAKPDDLVRTGMGAPSRGPELDILESV